MCRWAFPRQDYNPSLTLACHHTHTHTHTHAHMHAHTHGRYYGYTNPDIDIIGGGSGRHHETVNSYFTIFESLQSS